MTTLLKYDPAIEKHIDSLVEEVLKQPYKNFPVPYISRTWGMAPQELKYMEDNRRIIKRTGTKKDRRHPTFDQQTTIFTLYIRQMGKNLPATLYSTLKSLIQDRIAIWLARQNTPALATS